MHYRPALFHVTYLLVCLAATTLVAQEQPAKEQPFGKELLHQDFRGNPALPSTLKVVGPDFAEMNQPDDKGLRFTIPKTRKSDQPVGVRLTFSLSGDFEITGAYEVLSIDPPPGGPGVGVGLNVCIKNDYKKFGKIGRFMLAQKKGAYLLAESWDKEVKDSYRKKLEPSAALAGQVRLVRRNSKLHYFVAEAPGNVFRQIHTSEFSAEDVELVRFAVNNNGTAAGVDARLIDLKIRTVTQVLDQPDAPRAADPESGPDGPSKGGLWLVFILGLGITLVLAIGAGAWLILRQRGSAPESKPAVNADVSPASLVVTCAGCGKNLKVKAEMAGKKVKCSQCGKAVLVPEEP